MRIIEGIAFDLEGTIFDLENLHHKAHLQAAAAYGLYLTLEEAYDIPFFIGGPDDAVAHELALRLNQKIEPDLIIATKKRIFDALLAKEKHIRPRAGFHSFLKWVKGKEIKIAIGTVTNRELALYLLEVTGLILEFDSQLIVSREDVQSPKPAPDVYIETAKRIGISPENQLVFEDSIGGLTAARNAGCQLAAVPIRKEKSFIKLLKNSGAEEVFLSWKGNVIKDFIIRKMNLD